MSGIQTAYDLKDNLFFGRLWLKKTDGLLEVDNVILCTGQLSENSLYQVLKEKGIAVQLIGGADKAEELDAKRAIEQASKVAATI